jgi:hypothetical protein
MHTHTPVSPCPSSQWRSAPSLSWGAASVACAPCTRPRARATAGCGPWSRPVSHWRSGRPPPQRRRHAHAAAGAQLRLRREERELRIPHTREPHVALVLRVNEVLDLCR